MATVLTLIIGLCWTCTYLECARLGFRDRTYGMPSFALALNFSWEVVYAINGFGPNETPDLGRAVNGGWMLIDALIVATYLRHGRQYWPDWVPRSGFLAWSAAMLATAFVLQLLFLDQFGLPDAVNYSAFLGNLVMSVLFIDMLVRRRSAEGQSLLIAVSKCAGTLAATILTGWIRDQPFFLAIGLLCWVYDMIYIGLLWRVMRGSALTPSAAS